MQYPWSIPGGVVRIMCPGKTAPYIWVVARNTEVEATGGRVLVVNASTGGLLAQYTYNTATPAAAGVVATVVSK